MNWAELGTAFDELAALSLPERAARLEIIRLSDAPLAQELYSLLQAHDAADGFFEERVPRLFASLAPDFNLAAGERLLHFEILGALGEGSIAKVYLALDTELGRKVALKVTLNQSKEAKTLAHFSLDGIIQVHSEHVVERDGTLLRLMCLQLVAGPTLAKLQQEMRAQPLLSFMQLLESCSLRDAAFEPAALKWRELLVDLSLSQGIVLLGMRLAEILGHAHALGVLHLDIKPANILIDPYGRPFLSDFNVSTDTARIAQGDLRGLGGTPHYMPPEQARLFEKDGAKEASRLDARCDVYALGVVLKDLLETAGETSPGLLKILERATHPDQESRLPTAKLLAQELRAWLRSCLAEKEMPPVWRGLRWILNYPFMAAVVLTVLSQLVASVINISYNRLQIVAALTPAQNEIFLKCVAGYNLITYPLTLLCAAYALRALFIPADVTRARQTVLRIPLVMFLAISFGWLPGAWIFPRVIEHYAGPVATNIYWQFAGSFSLAWLISMTTSLAVILFVVSRSLYPKYWQGQSDVALRELRGPERLNRSLTFAAALVPLAGVLMAVLMAPLEHSPEDYRSLKILLMVTVGFGLLNLLLVQRLTQMVESAFAALKRPRSFD